MIWQLLLAAISVLVIACFSAAETAFVSSDKVSVVADTRSGIRLGALLFFFRNSESFFAAVVIAGNLFITLFSLLMELVFHEHMGLSLSLVLPLTTLLGFILGELIPKSVALENPDETTKLLLPVVHVFYRAAKPVITSTARISAWVAGLISHAESKPAIFQRRDIYRFLGDTIGGGYLDKIESDVIRRLLSSEGIPVKNIAVPRTSIVAAKLDTPIDKLRTIFEEAGKTKVVIYSSSIDNVVGVVHAKYIFRKAETAREIMSDVLFVPEGMSVLDLLDEFRTVKVYVAILIDEFGGTSGLVTSSDVMELFLGEVAVRSVEEKIKRIKAKQFIMKGTTELDEIEKQLRIKLPKSNDYTTIAGLVTYRVGRIPSVGESVVIGRASVRILKADGKRIDVVEFTLE
ncbi:MAG: hemolysin family protein [Bacteroidetes bacterium]|nr:hemolysin family protein [Bacteroidota bacterium]